MTSAPTLLGLVFGGVSGEHAVSIRSANTVARALPRARGKSAGLAEVEAGRRRLP